MTSTRPQEVSLARLLRVYESKAASSAGGAPTSPPATPSRGRRGAPSPSEEEDAPTAGGRSRASDDERHAPGGPSRPGFDAVNDAKAHQHVEVMRGLVTEIRARDPATADAYAARVDRVASTVVVALGDPGSTSSTSSSSRHRAAPYVTAAAGAASSSAREWRPYKPPAPVRRRATGSASSPDPKSSSGVAANTAGGGASRQRREGGVKISDAGDAHIARQRAAQEELTDEMLELAGGIKANSLAMEASLRESRRELDVVEGSLDRNLAGVKKERSRQKAIYETNRRGGCWTWIVLVLVGVVFTWVVVYMRFTHDRTKFRV